MKYSEGSRGLFDTDQKTLSRGPATVTPSRVIAVFFGHLDKSALYFKGEL
jgi:hypothetical protein